MPRRRDTERQEALAGASTTSIVREARAKIESLEGRGTGRQKRNHGPRMTVYCEQELIDRIDHLAKRMETLYPTPYREGKWSRSDIVIPLLIAALDMIESGELSLEPELKSVISRLAAVH